MTGALVESNPEAHCHKQTIARWLKKWDVAEW
jgi:hypothetical protein